MVIAQRVLVELDGATVLGLRRRLVAGQFVDLRRDHERRRLGALAAGGLQPGEQCACPRAKVLVAGLGHAGT